MDLQKSFDEAFHKYQLLQMGKKKKLYFPSGENLWLAANEGNILVKPLELEEGDCFTLAT